MTSILRSLIFSSLRHTAGDLFDNWFGPLEAEVQARSREFIEELLRGELHAALA